MILRAAIPIVAIVALAAALAGCGGGDAAPPAEQDAAARPGPSIKLRTYYPPRKRATGARRPAPAAARDAPSAGAPSDEQIRRELEHALGARDGDTGGLADRATITSGGMASVPVGVPRRVAAVISAGNQVARAPYVYGGGHGRLAGETFVDSAYDCSGSVSFALAAAGLATSPMDSGTLARWGKPGPGRWISIYANAGHAFMVVAGLRFDTSGRGARGSRWQAAPRTVSGFTVRHPQGL